MSHLTLTCTHRFDDGREAWGPWRHGARYVGRPQLEPCIGRTCALCQHREEYTVIKDDDTSPEG